MKRLAVAVVITTITAVGLIVGLIYWAAFRLARGLVRLALGTGAPTRAG